MSFLPHHVAPWVRDRNSCRETAMEWGLGKSPWLCYSRSCAVAKHNVHAAPLSPSNSVLAGVPKEDTGSAEVSVLPVKNLSLFMSTCIQNVFL